MNFNQKHEITIDSYSETVSSDDEASDDRTITADSDSSEAQEFEDTPYPVDMKVTATDIEATIHQIASGLQSAANGYLALASHLPHLSPYELPQTIAQIPPPPINVPMPIRKALATDGENKTIHYLLCSDYKLNKLSWNQLQKKYKVSRDTVYSALKGKRRPGGSQYCQKKKMKSEEVASTSNIQINELIIFLYFRYTTYRDDCAIRNYALRRYSANMGYTTTTLYVKNTFGSPTTKQK